MPTKQLHEVIFDNADRIVDVFVRKARGHDLPPRDADHDEIKDDLNRYVRHLAAAYQVGKNDQAVRIAKAHGGQRWYAGYDLKSVLLEYGVLRSVIADIVQQAGYEMTLTEVDQLAHLVNVGLAEAAVEFTARATDEINQALHAAQSAVRAREDIIAVVSHDLKNPLNVIYGGVAMLKEELAADDLNTARAALRSHAARIDRASVRMNRLISDLLDLAKIREGRVEIDIQPEQTSALLEQAVQQSAPLADLRPVRLSNEGGTDTVVCCDRERVLQVFDNIVGNAIKFSTPGGVIHLSLDETQNECRFCVRDEGPGIPEDQLPLLFDRFWTAPRSTEAVVNENGKASSANSGTGLGLAIARGIVEAHRGRIWVESRLGQGTCFYFTLPKPGREASTA